MTLTALKSKINTKFMKSFLLSIKSNKKMLIFISVMQLLGLPVISTLAVIASSDHDFSDGVSSAAFLMIAIFCLAAAVICGVFVALTNFSYLYKKSQVDMIYSLPIKRRTKFLSDFFSGLAVYVAPFIAACIIADIILFAKILCEPQIIAPTISEALKVFPIILQGELAAALMMTMLYTLTVVVTCCCGALFECILNMFLINALIPGAIAVVAGLFFANLYGVPILETALPALGYTSPVGAAIYLISSLVQALDYSEENCIPALVYGKWVFIFVLFIAAYFLLSMFLYKKRKAEDVSKPYVYKMFYYIIVTVIMMAISLIARFEIEVLLPVILFSLIVYMIFEVITNRGFKKIHMSFIRYGVTMLGILVMCVISSATNGFGAEGRVYPASLLSSVEVDYTGIDDFQVSDDNQYYGTYYYDVFHGDSIKYKDKDIIKKMTELHEDIIDTYKEGKYDTLSDIDGSYYHHIYDVDQKLDECYDYPMYHVQFKYNLKTGGSMVRNYQLSVDQVKQLFVLDHTEEMAEYRTELIREYAELSEYHRQHKTSYYELDYSLIKNVSDYTSIPLSDEEGEEFLKIYKQDYMNATTEELMTSKPVCYINAYIPIRESFTNTVEFIKSHGGLNEKNLPSYISEAEGILYKPEGYKSWGRNDITASFGYVETLGYYRYLDSEQINELMKYARSNYYEESDCYVLSLRHEYYVIPSEYSDIAEEIYNQASDSQYTFENFMKDLRASNSIESYIYDHLDGNYNFFDDIYRIYDMRFYETQRDAVVPEEYTLLKKFFGYTAFEEYEEYMAKTGGVYDGETAFEEFCRYKEEFPEISDERLKFFEYIN
ncbi:MAG: hypothetical protein NC320_10710 [Clostridium sp.]|nr:hypothetical protein [Clostridium sp.]MCM1548137.1 hypothetical protein [Ruminococcus sp.]